MTKQLIVVLSDGETWTDIENCQVLELDEEQYQRVLDGEKPSWIDDARSVSISSIYHVADAVGRL